MINRQLSKLQIGDARSQDSPVASSAERYERYQEWDLPAREGVARFVAAGGDEATYLVLGCATGANDVLPLAYRAPDARIVAGDIDDACLARLRDQARRERLHVRVRRIDLTEDLSALGSFDRVTLFFVVHRLTSWRSAIRRVAERVAPGGFLYLSEFVGPGGVIYLSNEGAGRARHGIARVIRRYFELHPIRMEPELKSTSIRPVLRELRRVLSPAGFREFAWKQSLTIGDMLERIEQKAYAPFWGSNRLPGVLARLRREFGWESSRRVPLVERIRITRFRRA